MKWITSSFFGLLFLLMTACGGASLEAEAKQAATFKCKMDKLEAEGKSGRDMMKKMNQIRKKYMGTEKGKEFDELFEKYKKECK